MTVVGLGAWCDYVTPDEQRVALAAVPRAPVPEGPPVPGVAGPESVQEQPGASFDVHEFAVLDDGRRLVLHTERGFGTSAPWDRITVADVEADVLTTVLPDDDDGEDHPWEWLAGLVRRHGVEVTAEELRGVPYVVELSPRLRARLRG